MSLLLLKAFALCRGAIRRERPHSNPLPIHKLTSYHFYPVAERDDSRANSVDGIGLGAAGNSSTEYGYIRVCTIKNRGNNPLAMKVLKVLRGLLLKKSPKQGLGQSPKVFPSHLEALFNRLVVPQNKKRLTTGQKGRGGD